MVFYGKHTRHSLTTVVVAIVIVMLLFVYSLSFISSSLDVYAFIPSKFLLLVVFFSSSSSLLVVFFSVYILSILFGTPRFAVFSLFLFTLNHFLFISCFHNNTLFGIECANERKRTGLNSENASIISQLLCILRSIIRLHRKNFLFFVA